MINVHITFYVLLLFVYLDFNELHYRYIMGSIKEKVRDYYYFKVEWQGPCDPDPFKISSNKPSGSENVCKPSGFDSGSKPSVYDDGGKSKKLKPDLTIQVKPDTYADSFTNKVAICSHDTLSRFVCF